MVVHREAHAPGFFEMSITLACVWLLTRRVRTRKRIVLAIRKINGRVGFTSSLLSPHQVLHMLAALLLSVTTPACAQNKSPDEVYAERIEQARASYRVAVAKQIREAKRVEVVLLRFDDLRKLDAPEDREGRFSVEPYDATTSVISQTVLDSAQAEELLLALAEQIEKPVHSEQFLGHFPVHGVRIYSDEPSGEPFDRKLIYSGSFCWVCHTFGFTYPDGAEWLDTNARLMGIFNRLLPIPKEELQRREMKHPAKQRERK